MKSGNIEKKRNVDLQKVKPKEIEEGKAVKLRCPVDKKCGGCTSLKLSYDVQLKNKREMVQVLLGSGIDVKPVAAMDNPYNYRNKVHAVFHSMRGQVMSGVYEAGTHNVVPVESCLIDDKKCDDIINTIRKMTKSFKITIYDEDTGDGFLRHVLMRRGFKSGEIMVVMVVSSLIFPSKNNFVKALLKSHPEITTIVLNENNKRTSMVLGQREKVIYGRGYIEDSLCGSIFRISSKSFYQVNHIQTEILYNKAIELLNLTGRETVIDAYCGIGTMGIIASPRAKGVIGVELNGDAVKDAIWNAKRNGISNVKFYKGDAGDFMEAVAQEGKAVDAVIMDPPRSGSTEKFIDSISMLKPSKLVYVSCNPETLARDLKYFRKKGYKASEVWPVDMFPHTDHVEVVVMLSRTKGR